MDDWGGCCGELSEKLEAEREKVRKLRAALTMVSDAFPGFHSPDVECEGDDCGMCCMRDVVASALELTK